jgi:hypothetical protein
MQARWQVACTLGACALGLSTGCERLLSIQDPIAGDGPTRDTGGDDGGITDAAPPASSPILLSEIAVTPNPAEMIEIVNTSNEMVDLSTYYLSDSGNYYRLPIQPTQTAVDSTDFIVKFPNGAQIPGHGVITVAIDMPANFMTTYGVLPSFSLVDGSMTTIAANGAPNLTNGGEPVILFQWDGQSDLVHDVDIMLVGVAAGANGLRDKSRALQDGVDPGTQQSQYAADANSIKPQAAAPGNGVSTKRLQLEGAHEVHAGTGNGQAGDDETSEDTAMTWDGTAGHAFTAPTPGDVPPELKP